MAIYLLDTTVIIDAINGKRGRDQLLDGLLEQRNLLACCSMNVTEVYAGMRPHEIKVTEAFLRSLKFYEVTWDIARRAGGVKERVGEERANDRPPRYHHCRRCPCQCPHSRDR